MEIVRIAVPIILLAAWGYGVFRCIKAVENLSRFILRTKFSRMSAFPSGELHPLLRMDGNREAERFVARVNAAGKQDKGMLSQFPDPEEEKSMPYYNRTGRIVCDLKLNTVEQISSGAWYGYAQWMQDVIACKPDDDCFGKSSSIDEGENDESV